MIFLNLGLYKIPNPIKASAISFENNEPVQFEDGSYVQQG